MRTIKKGHIPARIVAQDFRARPLQHPGAAHGPVTSGLKERREPLQRVRRHAQAQRVHAVQGDVVQREGVAHRRDLVAPVKPAPQRAPIGQGQQRRVVGHGVAEQFKDAPGVPEQAGPQDAGGRPLKLGVQVRIAAEQHAALVRGKPLAHGKAEKADVAGQPHAPASERRAECLRGVLDHDGSIGMGHGGDGGNVRSPAAQMRGDHGERGFIAAAPERAGIDSKPSGQRVARHGPQTGKPHGQRDERAGVGRDDDAAPARIAAGQRPQGHHEGGGAGAGHDRFGDAEPVPQPRRERLFRRTEAIPHVHGQSCGGRQLAHPEASSF